mmetsp:Transcript_17683/g.21687  ORF Transcript_17683/g.21687 Transcript_17683/m.21687 type:complete len:707 (+) Transcript_17683:143-2263(+)
MVLLVVISRGKISPSEVSIAIISAFEAAQCLTAASSRAAMAWSLSLGDSIGGGGGGGGSSRRYRRKAVPARPNPVISQRVRLATSRGVHLDHRRLDLELSASNEVALTQQSKLATNDVDKERFFFFDADPPSTPAPKVVDSADTSRLSMDVLEVVEDETTRQNQEVLNAAALCISACDISSDEEEIDSSNVDTSTNRSIPKHRRSSSQGSSGSVSSDRSGSMTSNFLSNVLFTWTPAAITVPGRNNTAVISSKRSGLEVVEYEPLSTVSFSNANTTAALCIVTRVQNHDESPMMPQRVHGQAVASQRITDETPSPLEDDSSLVEAATLAGRRALRRVDAQWAISRLIRLDIDANFLKANKSNIVRAPLACWFPALGPMLRDPVFDAWLLEDGDRKLKCLVGHRGKVETRHINSNRYCWLISLNRKAHAIFVVRLRIYPHPGESNNETRKRARADVLAAVAGGRPSVTDDAELIRFAAALRDCVYPHPRPYDHQSPTAMNSAANAASSASILNDVGDATTGTSASLSKTNASNALSASVPSIIQTSSLLPLPSNTTAPKIRGSKDDIEDVLRASMVPIPHSPDLHDTIDQLELVRDNFDQLYEQRPSRPNTSPLSPTRQRRIKRARAAVYRQHRGVRGYNRGSRRHTVCCSFCPLWGGIYGGVLLNTNHVHSSRNNAHNAPISPFLSASRGSARASSESSSPPPYWL